MTIEETIQKAIEGGYSVENAIHFLEWPNHLFDPIFWKSLGKAMGWPEGQHGLLGIGKYLVPYWHGMMLRFIDHLAGGKTIEEYFNQF